MKALLLPRYGAQGASSRIRILQFVEALEASGIHCVVRTLISDELLREKYRTGHYRLVALLAAYFARIRHLLGVRGFDIVWVEKEALPWCPAWFERLLYQGRPVVLDFDDAVFHNYDRHGSRWVRHLLGRRIDSIMGMAKLVVAGNNYLADRARLAGSPRVEVVPTVVDIARYTVHDRFDDVTIPRIVWIGSPSTAQYLASIAEPLAALASRVPFVLRVIGTDRISMAGVDIESFEWSAATEAQLIRECQVGIMPLFDSPWERGKCAYKLIQYMACGLPTVASAVGANVEVVQEGSTGYLVRDAGAWIDRLQELLADANLRRRMGEAGRERVQQRYSLQVVAPHLCTLFRQAAENRPCAA